MNIEQKPWFKKPLKPEEIYIGSLTCSTACRKAPLDMPIAVGFGFAMATKDGEVIYEEDGDDFLTVGDIEKMAVEDPDHNWEIVKAGPLHGETFQRHGVGEWNCVESNRGFA